jgi:hypothetical protein
VRKKREEKSGRIRESEVELTADGEREKKGKKLFLCKAQIIAIETGRKRERESWWEVRHRLPGLASAHNAEQS